jgi:uncharacterized hydrophobic protein (TIGR00271 family)
MSVIAFVPDPDAAALAVSWTRSFFETDESVEFLCWDRWRQSRTRDAVREALGDLEAGITAIEDDDVVAAVAKLCRERGARLLITGAFTLPGLPGQDSNALMAAAPCGSLVGLFGDYDREVRKVLVVVSGGAHDAALLDLVRRSRVPITVATVEADIGEGAEAVGQRFLERALHDANLKDAEHVETTVVVDNHPIRGLLRACDDQDLVIVGRDKESNILPLRNALGGTIAASVKRAPPLRRRALPDWMPRINPADYSELVQDLRSGSRWGADFIVMLAMASAIATLGLLQNSPAVVIGSMLLAPLMTPMIGLGLSIVQANPGLGSVSGRTIGKGVLLTLAISCLLGLVIPGGELLSEETLARGAPNVLDLLIALFAAVAATVALARPGLSGAVAGVAIATALVPPLCSVGISLAYGHWLNAFGAAALFVTNLIAIVLASALTFFLMGVTSASALQAYRRIARTGITVLVLALLALTVPLGSSLSDRIDRGSERPLGYPVKRTLARAIRERIDKEQGVELMFMARASVGGQVVIYVAADQGVSRKLSKELTRIARKEMDDNELQVLVFAVRLAWKD